MFLTWNIKLNWAQEKFSNSYSSVSMMKEKHSNENPERLAFPSAARADRAIFSPKRRTFLLSLKAWLLGLGPCIVAPPLNCCPFIDLLNSTSKNVNNAAKVWRKKGKIWAVNQQAECYFTWGPRKVPCLALPVPFCRQGFLPVPLTSLIVFVECVPCSTQLEDTLVPYVKFWELKLCTPTTR